MQFRPLIITLNVFLVASGIAVKDVCGSTCDGTKGIWETETMELNDSTWDELGKLTFSGRVEAFADLVDPEVLLGKYEGEGKVVDRALVMHLSKQGDKSQQVNLRFQIPPRAQMFMVDRGEQYPDLYREYRFKGLLYSDQAAIPLLKKGSEAALILQERTANICNSISAVDGWILQFEVVKAKQREAAKGTGKISISNSSKK